MDISDIQSSIDKLCDSLTRVGIDTEALSERMTKALTDVSKSDDDLATKTQRAMQILKSAMDDAVKSIQIVPDMIDNANKRVGDIESSISKLNEKLNDTEKGSGAFEAITRQINAQKQSLQLAKEDVIELTDSYNHAKNSISEVSGAYQALGALSVASTGANSAQTVSNSAVSASATAAATATVAEATAHSANTAAATANAVAESQNAQATQQLTDSLREYISVSAGRAEIDRMQSENAKDLKSDIKLYEDTIKEIQNTLNTSDFSGKIKETTEQIEKYKLKISSYKQEIKNLSADENSTGQGVNYYNRLISSAEQKISDLQKKVNEWGQEQNRLNSDLQEYNTLLDAAKRIQSGEKLTDSFKNTAKEAKETAKETQNIGKEAKAAGKKVKGIFGGLKSSFAGLMKGDFSALFGFIGKIGAWGAAIAAVGKGLYDTSKAAEAFRVSLQPLDHYMDSDKIKDLRQNILALSATTSKSCVDMAQSATQFVKVWDGLNDSPEALTRMIKAANEFGALAGKTSAESAKNIAEISGEYHLTADEATKMSNVIATASRNTTSSFGEMAEAIKSAGSTASLYGISFKEMSSLIGFSSNQFGGASKAASKFSMLLMSMSKLQKEYNPSMVGMVTALKNLKEAYDRGENVGEKFMARNRATAMYFIKNAEAIEKYTKTIGNAATKEELLADINTRADVNLKKLNNAWNGFLTSLNANLTPVLTGILRFFNRIIGGASRTADELNYLKNYDKNHKGSRKSAKYVDSATSGMGAYPESAVVAMGANESYQSNKKENLELYRKQRDRLQKWYEAGVNAAKRRHKNASSVALANAGENVVRNVLKKSGNKYSEFNTDILDDFLSRQRRSTYAMQQKTINTDVKLGGIGGKEGTQEKNKTVEKQKKAQEELNKMLLELEQKNIDATIALMQEGTEKKLKEIDNDYKKRLAEIEKQEDEFRKKNKEAGKGATLTDAQSKAIEESKTLASQDRSKKIEKLNNDLIESEKSGLYAFLKEYGDIQDKKLAITEEYADKIAKAENAYQKASLANQRDNELKKLDASDVFEQIDWGNVFSDLSSHTKEYLESLRNQLQTLLKSGKLTDIEDIAKVQEKINDINSEISKQGGLFDFVGEKQQEHIRRINEAKEAQEALNSAKSKEVDIEKQYEEALKAANYKATDLGVRAIGDDTAGIQSNLDKFGIDKSTKEYKEMSTLLSQLAVLEGKLAEARKKTAKATAEAKSKEDGAKRSSAQSVADWFADAQEFITKKGIDELPGLFENLGMGGVAKKASEGLSAFNDASGAAADFATGNYVGALTKGVSAIQGFTSVLGIGGDNTAKMQNSIDELTQKNNILAQCLDNLNDTIQNSSLYEAQNAYEEAKKLTAQSEANEQNKMYYEAEKHGRWRVSLNKSVEDNKGWKTAMSTVSSLLDRNIKSSWDFLHLSAEEMKKIRDYDGGELLNNILNEYRKEGGKNGKSDQIPDMVTNYIKNYANAQKELDEQMIRRLTNISFDDLKSNFKDTLKDMSKSAQDFADDFSGYLFDAVLDAKIGDLLDKELQSFYDEWAKMAENGLTSDEISQLNKKYNDIVQKGMQYRDEAAKITGYAEVSSQSATNKAIEAITADQASTLIGIGYAMQIAVEQGNETRAQMSADISVMRSFAENMAVNMTEMRDIQYEGLGQLQQIVKNTAPIILIREDIANMYNLMKKNY
uniref:Tape measure domain protein n=1 Tax=Siphoviridae sp. ctA4S13 TaxID=2826179 RepID=A0A8S5MQD3_9CAUD|nr:MAG TPA: Tape measure domain protein [Siphoviridae sp. ctA4S13]